MTKKVVVVGCGDWGKNLIRNFANLGALYGVCDRHADRAGPMATLYTVPALSWEEALQDPQVPIIAICTPADSHYSLALQALNAGKHVFVEKPLALCEKEAENLTQAAQQRGLILMTGHLLQYHPTYQKLKALIQQGKIGQVRFIYANRLNLGKITNIEDSLWSLAPHDVSMILGIMDRMPESVSAQGAYCLDHALADMTTIHMTFAHGARALVSASWIHPYKEQRLVVIGEQGALEFDDTRPWEEKLSYYPHSITGTRGSFDHQAGERQFIPTPPSEPLREECLSLLRAVDTGAPPLSGPQEALRVTTVLAQAYASLMEKFQPQACIQGEGLKKMQG